MGSVLFHVSYFIHLEYERHALNMEAGSYENDLNDLQATTDVSSDEKTVVLTLAYRPTQHY